MLITRFVSLLLMVLALWASAPLQAAAGIPPPPPRAAVAGLALAAAPVRSGLSDRVRRAINTGKNVTLAVLMAFLTWWLWTQGWWWLFWLAMLYLLICAITSLFGTTRWARPSVAPAWGLFLGFASWLLLLVYFTLIRPAFLIPGLGSLLTLVVFLGFMLIFSLIALIIGMRRSRV